MKLTKYRMNRLNARNIMVRGAINIARNKMKIQLRNNNNSGHTNWITTFVDVYNQMISNWKHESLSELYSDYDEYSTACMKRRIGQH